MNVYFISGLAADRRVFQNIQLPEGYSPHYLDWITPHKDESLQHYAERLTAEIDPSTPFVVVGVSFGGMLAIEIAKKFPAAKPILISSVPSSGKLPAYFKWAGKLRLHKLVPVALLKFAAQTKRLFTVETVAQKQFLNEMIRKSDPDLIRWSINAILNWRSEEPSAQYIHIHGSRDEILPLKYAGATHVVKGAGHMMVLTRSKEINIIIRDVLRNTG
jgi:pimeloyl-ACP methyl ester carboxylesterase